MATKGKSSKQNRGPARDKYWSTNRLQENKVRRIMQHTAMTKAEAIIFWQDARQGRRTRTGSGRVSLIQGAMAASKRDNRRERARD